MSVQRRPAALLVIRRGHDLAALRPDDRCTATTKLEVFNQRRLLQRQARPRQAARHTPAIAPAAATWAGDPYWEAAEA